MIGHKTHTRYKLGRAVGSTPVWGDTWYENEVLENMPTRYVNYNKYFSNVYLGDSNSPNTPTTEGLHGVMIGYAGLSDLNSANGDSWEYDFTSNVVVTTRRLLKITITQPNTFVKEINIPDVSRATIPDNEALAVTLGDVVYLLVEMVFELKRSTTSSLNILAYDSSAPYTQGALKRNIPINRILYRVYNQSLPPKDNYGVLSNQTLQPVGLYTQNINGLTVSNLPQPNFIGHCNISAGTEWDGEHPWIGANIIAGQLDNSYAISFIDIRLNIEMILDLGPSPVNFRLYGGGLRILMDAPLDNTFIEPETFPAPMRFVGYSGYGLEIIANRGKFTTSTFTAIRNNVWDGTPVLLPTSYESNALYSAEFTCIGPFTFTSRPASSAQNWLRRIDSWGGLTYNGLKLRDSFLESIPVTLPPGLTNLDNTFELSYIVDIVQQIQQWNTSTVTSFDSTFANLFSVDNDLDLSGWDVSNATSMRRMFYGWPQNTIVAVTGLNNWDVSKVTDMSDMFNPNPFYAGDNLRNIPIENQGVNVIANWNTSAVTNFDRMFKNTRSDLILNIRDWCVSNINTPPAEFAPEGTYLGNVDNQPIWGFCPKTDIIVEVDSGTFTLETTDATKGQQVKLDGTWYDIESLSYPITVTGKKNIGIRMGTSTSGTEVTLSGTAPRRILSLAKQPTNNNAGAVIKFGGCTNLTVCLPDLPTWITSTSGMFEGCTALVSTGIRTTSQVTNMASMFHGCTNFTGSNLEHWDVSNVVYMYDMFNGVSSNTFNADISGWNTGNVIDMSNMFRGVTNFASSLSNWNVSKVTNFSYMFADSNFNQNIDTWDLIAATNLQGMFHNATLFNQPISNWNTSKVTDMSFMFDGASDFNQNLHYLKTHKVTTMEAMFRNAESFDQDIALWAVYNITSLPNQFAENCPTNPLLYPMWGYNAGEDVIFKTKPTAVSINIRVYNGERYRFGLGEWVEVSGQVGGFATINFPVNTISSIYAGNNTRNNAPQWFQNVTGVDELISMSPFINYGARMNFSASTGLTKVLGRFNYFQTNCDRMFDTCTQLVEVRFDLPSAVTNINRMFFNCANLEIIGSNWDTSGVTTTTYAFNGCSKFNHDISSWNVDNVTLAQGMFIDCSKFNRNINSWNLNKATNLANFFQNCTDFNQPLNDWYVSLVTNFTGMFRGCSSFNQNINNWDVSSATTMFQMFSGASSFNQPLNNWNVAKVTTMEAMFRNASSFNQNINNWDTSKVTNLFETFDGATSFNQPLNDWNVANVTNMTRMFYRAASFNQPLNNWNVAKVTNMSYMFRDCSSFNQPLNNWNLSAVNTMIHMFSGASSFNQPLNNWNVAKVTNMSYMFRDCSSFNQPLNNWNTAKVTNMFQMFRNATAFNSDITTWDTGNVTNMQAMFQLATNFNQNINTWNLIKVTNISFMFQDAINFNQPLNNWDVSNVTTMLGLFNRAASFNQPLNNWNTGKVTSMSDMFSGASSFYQDLYAWRPHLIDRIATIPSNFIANTSMEQWLTPWSFGLVPTFRLLMKQELDVGSGQRRYDLDVYYEGGAVGTSWVSDNIIPADTQNKVTLKHYLTVQAPEEFLIYTNRAELGAPPSKLVLNGNNILEVRAWESPLNVSPLTTVSFKNSPNLTVLPTTLKSSITSLESLAENCPLMASNITDWDTTNVANFKNAFKDIPNFNQDISGWNMVNATDISGMLRNCVNFNQPIGSWDVSSVVTMENLFAGVTNFNKDLSGWDVSNVSNMDGMFNGVNVYSYDLSLWCVTNIPALPTNFASSGFPKSYYPQWGSCMFKNFNQDEDLVLEHSGSGSIDIYLFTGDKYTHNSITTTASSNGVVSLNVGGIYIFEILPRAGMKIPIAGNGLKRVINWPYLTAISTGYTFLNASNLEFVPAYLPTYVENCVQMFEGCTNFNRDISIWDMAAITSMLSMFRNASNFNIAIGEWNVANVTNMDGLFDNAIAFDQDLSMWCVTNITEEPTNFNTNGLLDSAQKPVWGTCPTEET